MYLEFIQFTVMFEILLLENLFFGDLSVVVNTNGDSVSSRKSYFLIGIDYSISPFRAVYDKLTVSSLTCHQRLGHPCSTTLFS